jgi:hypothetical protein
MPADQKEIWLNDHIWPEIHAMMHNDAYFRLWLQAQELAERPYGPIGDPPKCLPIKKKSG